MNKLEVTNLTKKFGKITIHNQWNYTFYDGCYIITGENGIGKTVLLEVLSGSVQADAGEVLLNESQCVSSLSYKQQLAYVPASPLFFPMVNGGEFLSFIQAVKDRNFTNEALKNTYAGYQLENHLTTQFKNMSLGIKKKFFLSTLGIQQHAIVLLDEPTNALDESAKSFLKNEIIKISKNTIIIIASHDFSYFADIDHTVIELNANRAA